ncbi:hypothetical protein Nstercoris_00261 [Nitrosomonas stercoris]|uniref:Uncharacterized protein n=1 Tax=Nitrosomonas stercoris TaxID=1444684 RepID=A0A4Y1YIW7_9PROT|nr:hypothetical protein Nstercoris_00261 [Nitrosomonas stercoris]
MNIKIKKQIALALSLLLAVGLAMPSVAHAGKRYSHHQHYKQPKRHVNQHRHHHVKKYVPVPVYRQPSIYYQQYYPQPQYNYYSPAPVYVVPPQVNMGIHSGNVDLRLRF